MRYSVLGVVALLFVGVLDAQDAGGGPTGEEQLFVQVVNRARMDPGTEAKRIGVGLNEGLPAGTISERPKQPLAINVQLLNAARGHTKWMFDEGKVSHKGEGNSRPEQRVERAGYKLEPPAGTAENLGFTGTTDEHVSAKAAVDELHRGLYIDEGVADRGHRVNIMLDDMREVGISLAKGQMQQDGNTFNSWIVTQSFAFAKGNPFMTGVVYADGDGDRFYSVGEGRGGVTVTAKRQKDGKVFAAKTWGSGGYSLQVPEGMYEVNVDVRGTKPLRVKVGKENVLVEFAVDR